MAWILILGAVLLCIVAWWKKENRTCYTCWHFEDEVESSLDVKTNKVSRQVRRNHCSRFNCDLEVFTACEDWRSYLDSIY